MEVVVAVVVAPEQKLWGCVICSLKSMLPCTTYNLETYQLLGLNGQVVQTAP